MISGASVCRYLLDTNIILYPNDLKEPVKKMQATELLRRLKVSNNAALPAQALTEFSSVALRKMIPPMDWDAIYRQVQGLSKDFPVLPLTSDVVLEALEGVRNHLFSYYDAQIWAIAKLYNIPIVLSEDFNSGSVIEGVTFLNPFESSFDLTVL